MYTSIFIVKKYVVIQIKRNNSYKKYKNLQTTESPRNMHF